ncbi:integration host factor (IHF),beta subunit, site specific recombination [Moraxella macacae 0408225]|uniref:Integration host factor (IHF),beta subunit, site specific recombination n=1 Tax=Moraxella macacae 0408225 TaxID=1230338 RepID=L2F6X8_9GAMM|nr:HU family DNA-binding protein [Moraxella macacae]ELA08834.1 integration host factor (IHF),beta subunit, site specific recombination [Moraxella macacae 0408225]
MEKVINKSDLIDKLSAECRQLSEATVEEATKQLLDLMANVLANDGRVEVRGFGSFSLHHRKPRTARNLKTGEKIPVESTAIPHFKPGKALREAVNKGSV